MSSNVILTVFSVYIVTCEEEVSVPLPDGLVLVEDFVSQEEEAVLLAAIDWSSTNDDFTGERKSRLFCFLNFGLNLLTQEILSSHRLEC